MGNGSSEDRKFLGKGIAFPFAVDSQGHIAMNSFEDQVRQSILLILKTAKGERVMRPDFGAGLSKVVFEPIGSATKALVKHEVEEALIKFEPRIEVLEVDVDDDEQEQGKLLISMQYRVRRTDTTFNMVYPFYLERGEL